VDGGIKPGVQRAKRANPRITFVQDTDGYPPNYAKLPPPIMMRADVLTMIGDWLAQRLR